MVHRWAALVATLAEGVEDLDSNLARMDPVEDGSDLEISSYTFSYTIDM